MKTTALSFSSLFVVNSALMGALMLAVFRSVMVLSTSTGNPLLSSIPVMAGISFFYIFDNFGKLLRLTDGVAEHEVRPLLQFCSGRCVSSFVLVALVTILPEMIR